MNPRDLIEALRDKTSRLSLPHLSLSHLMRGWSLDDLGFSSQAPAGFIQPLKDPWMGQQATQSEQGRKLCAGTLYHGADSHHFTLNSWGDGAINQSWQKLMHEFEWLGNLKALGGDQPRMLARQHVQMWLEMFDQPASFSQGRGGSAAWRGDILGARLSQWAFYYDFFGATASENFQARFFSSYLKQARYLSRHIDSDMSGAQIFDALHGLIVAGIALQGRESWLEQGLDRFQSETEKQILPDGGHISRSPAQLLRVLKCCISIRTILTQAGYPVPALMQHTIDRMAQAVRFFRFADRKFVLFHGTPAGDIAYIDMILNKANARGKILNKLPQSGFERLTKGRSVVMMDCGLPPKAPFDKHAHAAPLAFEFCYGKERVFVSCGTHPFDAQWGDDLRATAAHNALEIDHRNACEIKENGHLGRTPRKMSVHREENHDAVLVEGSHDGYAPINGIVHRRRIYLGDNGHNMRGEENLTCSIGLNRPVGIYIRFHLHPGVQVSLIRDGEEALLRLPGGAGWRFVAGSGTLKIENSVYFGAGTQPRKTKQIVITGMMEADHSCIKWALQREG